MYKIVKAKFPFVEDINEYKTRPILLLTYPVGEYDLSLGAFITSKIPIKILPTDVILDLKKFKDLNLSVNSVIRLHKISSICLEFVEGEYADLPETLVKEVKEKLKVYLDIF